jgi:hypothetical protein
MEDFSEVTDLETARRVLIGYDKAFRENAEIHTQMKAETERLREALTEVDKALVAWMGKNSLIRKVLQDYIKTALKGDE